MLNRTIHSAIPKKTLFYSFEFRPYLGGGGNLTSCTDCPSNTYAYGDGWGCRFCPPGKDGMGSGLRTKEIDCEDCAQHKYSIGDGLACKSCPAGFETHANGSRFCSICQAQYFREPGAQTGCKLCPVGKENQNAGNVTARTGCNSCPDGKYANQTTANLMECLTCFPGKWSN